MNAKKAKIFLINNDLTVSDIARRIAAASSDKTEANEASLRSMITDMINGRRYYPSLAEEVERTVGLKLVRPRHLQPYPARRAA